MASDEVETPATMATSDSYWDKLYTLWDYARGVVPLIGTGGKVLTFYMHDFRQFCRSSTPLTPLPDNSKYLVYYAISCISYGTVHGSCLLDHYPFTL
jgi:hypothetical protein